MMDTTLEARSGADLLKRALARERKARQAAEQLLEDKSRELYDVNEALRKQFDVLSQTQAQLVHSEKMASIGQLAAGVAHEINNPISYVTSNVGTLADYVASYKQAMQLCLDIVDAVGKQDATKLRNSTDAFRALDEEEDFGYLSTDVDELLAESKSGLERVKEIVQNLKTFVRLDEADVQNVDINECLESTLRVVDNEIRHKCTVEKRYSELPKIVCHPGQLNQVFMNLIMNAVQAIDEHGDITIETLVCGESVLVKISDTGSGIPPGNIPQLFTPFFTTKPVGSGTGLGLSISFGIVEEHGGTIEVASEVGKGTCFTITLPIAGNQS